MTAYQLVLDEFLCRERTSGLGADEVYFLAIAAHWSDQVSSTVTSSALYERVRAGNIHRPKLAFGAPTPVDPSRTLFLIQALEHDRDDRRALVDDLRRYLSVRVPKRVAHFFPENKVNDVSYDKFRRAIVGDVDALLNGRAFPADATKAGLRYANSPNRPGNTDDAIGMARPVRLRSAHLARAKASGRAGFTVDLEGDGGAYRCQVSLNHIS